MFTLCFPLQSLVDCKFKQLSGRAFSVVNLEFFINMGLLLANLLIFSQLDMKYFKYTEDSLLDYFNTMRDGDTGSTLSTYFYASLSGLIWMKVLYLLRLNRIVGPLLKIVRRMAADILNFLSLLALVMVSFSCVGIILFRVEEFSSF